MFDAHISGLSAGIVALVHATVFYGIIWVRPRKAVARLATVSMVVALAIHLWLLGARWIEAGRPPFKTLHESLILLTTCIVALYLVFELVYRLRALGVAAGLGALASSGYALLRADKEIVNLPAALQSGWFVPHVIIYFVAYAALFLGAALAVFYLFKPKPIVHQRDLLLGPGDFDVEARMDQAVRFGFVLLTAGLFMGAAWAKVAWGDYWVWDPKENWSLVSWLVFAVYLHLRHVHSWRGRRAAIIVLVGLGVVMFTYLGMHLLPTAEQSAHVYQ